MTEKADVVIIGAGSTGLSAAYELAKSGVDVLLIEKSFLAAEASGRNPGGIRLLGRDEAEVPLMLQAMKRWHGLEEELGMNMELSADGYLWVALNEKELKIQQDLVERDAAYGIKEYILLGSDLKEFAPAISTDTVIGALWSPTDYVGNPFRVTMGYYRAAQRYGARFMFDTEVTGFKVEGGRVRGVDTSRGPIAANTVIIAAGPWSDPLGRMVGLDIPITPCPNQIHITEPVPWRIMPPFLLISSKAICRQSARGHVYTGNTNAPGGYTSMDKTADNHEIVQTAAYISQIIPPLKPLKYIRSWVGIIDFTPDDNFIFGHVDEVESVVLACGFSGHGFALTPVIGQLLSELVRDGQTSLPTEAFHLNRFKEGRTKQTQHFAHQHMND